MRFAWTRRVVLSALTVIAGCVFLVSMLNPFVSARLWPLNNMPGQYSGAAGEFWSFKDSIEFVHVFGPALNLFNVSISEHWFADCWSLENGSTVMTGFRLPLQVDGPGMSVLTFVFASQVLTLGLMVSSLFVRKFASLLLLGAAIFSLMSVLGMWLFTQLIHEFERVEAGYGLAMTSVALFSAIFLTSLIWNSKRARSV